LNEIIQQLKRIRSIQIEGTEYFIDWTLGGDLKWLAMINGINAANSNHPCIWCLWNQNTEFNENEQNKNWPISRTYNEAIQAIISNNNLGYLNVPLLNFINFDKNIIDTLHLLLRVTDKLFEKLLSFLEYLDNNQSLNFQIRPRLRRLNEVLLNECKITTPLYLAKSGNVKLRSMNQDERIKFLKFGIKNIYPEMIPQDENETDNNKIKMGYFAIAFKKFYTIFIYIKQDFSHQQFDFLWFNEQKKVFLEAYLLINETNKITPYIHALFYHIPEFIQKYKNLSLFQTQSLEKLNDIRKIHYFRNSNKKKEEFVEQLLEKANRLEFIYLNGTLNDLFQRIV